MKNEMEQTRWKTQCEPADVGSVSVPQMPGKCVKIKIYFPFFSCCSISYDECRRAQSVRDTAMVRLVDVFGVRDNRGHKS